MTLGEISGLEMIWRRWGEDEYIGRSMQDGKMKKKKKSDQISLWIERGRCFSLIMLSGSRSGLGSPKFSPMA